MNSVSFKILTMILIRIFCIVNISQPTVIPIVMWFIACVKVCCG